jgi:hypothetical protein
VTLLPPREDDPVWKRPGERHRKAWQRFIDRSEVHELAQDAIDVYARAWLMVDQHEGDIWMGEPEVRAMLDEYQYDLRIDLLTDLARQLEPELASFFGVGLRAAVHYFVSGVAVREFEKDEGVDRRRQQLPPLAVRGVPGTDLRIDAEGVIMVGPTTDARARRQLEKFRRAYEPARQRGRPAGSTDYIKDDEARRAWEMHSAGRSWEDIAEAVDGLRPDKVTDDPNYDRYDTIKRRVFRLVARGRKLSRDT